MVYQVPPRKDGPRALAASAEKTYYSYVDTPGFSYAHWMDSCDGPIGAVDPASAEKAAVIGAGLAGLAATYELLRAGVDVTLFEASDRIGGRLYSKSFFDDSKDLAELGAMRFPPSEELLFRYIDQFGIRTTPDFPDPGAVETLVSYQGDQYTFTNKRDQNVPEPFKALSHAWGAFLKDGASVAIADAEGRERTVTLAPPDKIAAALTFTSAMEKHEAEVDPVAAWKTYIEVFANKSLYDGLMLIFSGPNPPGGKPWAVPDDYERFAALGAGFGGFGPLYQVGFLDILRLMVNGLETDQRFIPGGVHQIAQHLYEAAVTPPGGAATSVQAHTHLNSRCTGIYLADGGGRLVLLGEDGAPLPDGPYGRVIMATTHRSMEIDGKLGLFNGFEDPQHGALSPGLETQPAAGVCDLHIMNSSKVFLRTETQFWKTLKEPVRCILSDTLSTNLYTLDYHETTGVVLVSYVWGDQSIKQLTFQDKRARLEMLRAALAPVAPDFARELHPKDGDYEANVQMIDWELEPGYFGAFKLNRPGQNHYVQDLFFDFQKVKNDPQTARVFVAGDSVSWVGGWTEGALQTAMNAAVGVLAAMGGKVFGGAKTPLTLDADLYDYTNRQA
ncbi:MAG: NAD(P)/FAD-dependent oxidoreductase [Marivibrio sp.]|uniref:NAD(P)/FAD-dependent oxidoreductase n=1 Tax=Marivibrio sp. TaxID=2039719 RepID=UPI0032EEB01E